MPGERAARLALLLVVAVGGAVAAEWRPLPPTMQVLVDAADIVDAERERRIADWIQELHEKTGAQVKVATWPDIGDLPMTEAALSQAETWRLGRGGHDDGALLALALRQRQVRIEVGYGLEGILSDSWCGSLSRAVATGYFRRGVYGEGLTEMVQAVAHRIAAERGVALQGVPQARLRPEPPRGGGEALFSLIWFAFIAIIVIASLSSRSRRHRHRGIWGFPVVIGGGRGGWSGGGGFSGRSFGGFSGGGGSFGGGGGGASW